MKMTIDSPNEPKVLANLQLCDVEVSLVLNCLILLLEVVHYLSSLDRYTMCFYVILLHH
jgi:hypothetical protein